MTLLLQLLFLLLPTPPGRPAHPGPPVYIEVQISDKKVTCTVTGEQETINPWLGCKTVFPPGRAGDRQQELMSAAARFFDQTRHLAIDGELAPFVVEDLVFPNPGTRGYGVPAVRIVMTYACKQAPKQVSLTWQHFEGDSWGEEPSLPALIKHGRRVIPINLDPDEPCFIWHPKPGPRKRSQPLALVTSGTERGSTKPYLPGLGLALCLAVLALTSVPVLIRRKAPRRVALGLPLGALVLALVVWAASRSPGTPDRPTTEQALGIFETLHQNIYRAFTAQGESQIYDELAISVSPNLLDELYGEIYESLIMRSQGGAVCKIDSVEVLERGVAFEDEGLAFQVDWKWKVKGSVTHFGHQHTRMNQYHADYRVDHDGQSWKIRSVKVKAHRRVNDG